MNLNFFIINSQILLKSEIIKIRYPIIKPVEKAYGFDVDISINNFN
jgi:DNA polymerase sigma